jgi:hypothetical protein
LERVLRQERAARRKLVLQLPGQGGAYA